MVSQKKGVQGKKKQAVAQPKQKIPPKMFEMKDDSEDDDEDLSGMESDEMDSDRDGESDSDEAPPQKTPNKKNAHVSFQLPTKGTPGPQKTPKNQPATPMPGKKQMTPKGKNVLAEFTGMKGNTPAAKPNSAKKGKDVSGSSKLLELDDEDEDDDDDDFDEEEDDEDEEGDDVDDEDDDDVDEDDESLDSAEEEEIKKKLLDMQKGMSNKNSTPGKQQKQTPVQKQTPAQQKKDSKKQTPAANKGASPTKQQQPVKKEDANIVAVKGEQLQRKRERDVRTLFVKNFSASVTEQDLKALSPDILNVSLRTRRNAHGKSGLNHYAFLEFASEAKAEENHELLKKKKLKDAPLFVDYSGEKSATFKKVPDKVVQQEHFNLKSIHLSGFPIEVSIKDVAQLYPKAISVRLFKDSNEKTSIVDFETIEEAAEAFKSNTSFRGRQLTVLYTKQQPHKNKKRRRNSGGPPQKKLKPVKQESSSDE